MYLFGVCILFSTTWQCDQTVIFFQSLIHLPQTKQKPHIPWCYCLFFFCHIYKQLLFFFGNSVYVYFRGDLQYSLSISLTLHKNLNLVSSLKKVQYFKDNTVLGFITPYGRQLFPNKKEAKVLLLTRRVFASQLYSSS